MTGWADAWRRIGGPNSVTWPGFAFTLVAALLVDAATSAGTSRDVRTLAPVLVGQAVAYGMLALARLTLLRPARSRPIPVRTVAAFAIASLIGGIGSGVAAVALGLGSGEGSGAGLADAGVALLSIVGSIVSATITFSAAAVVVDAWREYRDRRRAVAQALGRLDDLRTTIQQDQEAVAADVRTRMVAAILDELSEGRDADPRVLSEQFRRTADDVVRPLSHRLLREATDFTLPPLRPHGIDLQLAAMDATTAPLLFPRAQAVLVMMPVLFLGLLSMTAGRAVAMAVATVLMVVGLGWSVNRAYAPLESRLVAGARVAVLMLACAAVAGGSLVTWIIAAGSAEEPWRLVPMATLVALIGLLLPVAKVAAAQEERDDRDLEGATDELAWETARAKAVHWAAQNSLARALHGPVQSALVAAALRLDAAAPGPVPESVLAEARDGIAKAIEELAGGSRDVPDLSSALERLRVMWAGSCVISFDCAPALLERIAEDDVCARAAASVLTEACSDAIRHSRATSVQLGLSLEGDGVLVLRAWNPVDPAGGSGPAATPGVGTALLDAVSLSWSRSISDDSAELVVRLPLR